MRGRGEVRDGMSDRAREAHDSQSFPNLYHASPTKSTTVALPPGHSGILRSIRRGRQPRQIPEAHERSHRKEGPTGEKTNAGAADLLRAARRHGAGI